MKASARKTQPSAKSVADTLIADQTMLNEETIITNEPNIRKELQARIKIPGGAIKTKWGGSKLIIPLQTTWNLKQAIAPKALAQLTLSITTVIPELVRGFIACRIIVLEHVLCIVMRFVVVKC